ncbi:hypothetical protein T4D_2728 [Trichinella pseudospiralis]|uniref:Uncharacterized protein n=1 Tax=Trichinella pseudospiralis TaxID=6337 RepID=A0A0V1G341_TRIPS|nr:hypothetical protein T4D_2728 [Trichinella pseudospiralis]
MASAVFVILLTFLAFYPADVHSLSTASLSKAEKDAKELEDCMAKEHLEMYLDKPEIVVLHLGKEE